MRPAGEANGAKRKIATSDAASMANAKMELVFAWPVGTASTARSKAVLEPVPDTEAVRLISVGNGLAIVMKAGKAKIAL